MTIDYTEIARDVQAALQEAGATGTITRKDRSGSYDPALGTVVETTTTQTIIAAVFPVEASMVNGTTVQFSDETAYMSALGAWEPKAADVLEINGQKYTVIGVRWTAPAGVAVLGELLVRR